MDQTPEQIPAETRGPIKIDLASVVRGRLGWKARLLPGWFVRKLEDVVCQDRLNEMLQVAYPRRGAAFCRAVVNHLRVRVDVRHAERLPATDNRRVIFVSNHPLGGLDGMILIDLVAARYGCAPRFVVNDLLMAVEPLKDVFLPVNKHGAQSRDALQGIDKAMAEDVPVVIFPAGLCSRRRDGVVADLEWKKMFVQKAREYGRDIIPLHFQGENSSAFYRTAAMRERLGIKFNIEMTLLPSEVFKAEGKTFAITVGEPIPYASLGPDARTEALKIRNIVYGLPGQA